MVTLTTEEISTLRKFGIAIFANRVIFDAQPPMTKEAIQAVEDQCVNKLPPQLVELWSITAGGRLDYDLTVEMKNTQQAISFTELFYDGSDFYRDLQGWIEHEDEMCSEIAQEQGLEWDSKLGVLPFGGFEYCDRIYAVVAEGEDYGHILAWKHGFPPSWTGCLHEDTIATVATDLVSAFKCLVLEEDPRAPISEYNAGEDLLEYISEQVPKGLPEELSEKLIDFYCQAIVAPEQ